MANHLIDLDYYDLSVDATCGNGRDTLKLAKRSKQVIACDIQKEAINRAKAYTSDYSHIEYFHISHEKVHEYIHTPIDLVVFNCGYLPGSDKVIQTSETTVIPAISRLLPLLSTKGRVLIVTYPGTEEGFKEDLAIDKYIKTLKQNEVDVFTFKHENGRNMPAKLYILEKNAR